MLIHCTEIRVEKKILRMQYKSGYAEFYELKHILRDEYGRRTDMSNPLPPPLPLPTMFKKKEYQKSCNPC